MFKTAELLTCYISVAGVGKSSEIFFFFFLMVRNLLSAFILVLFPAFYSCAKVK